MLILFHGSKFFAFIGGPNSLSMNENEEFDPYGSTYSNLGIVMTIHGVKLLYLSFRFFQRIQLVV